MPRKPNPASHPRAPDVAVPLSLLVAVALAPVAVVADAATAELDGDADCNVRELAVTGEGDGVGVCCALVVGGVERTPLPCTLALALMLTPTLPQSCCAKARTSAVKISLPIGQS